MVGRDLGEIKAKDATPYWNWQSATQIARTALDAKSFKNDSSALSVPIAIMSISAIFVFSATSSVASLLSGIPSVTRMIARGVNLLVS